MLGLAPTPRAIRPATHEGCRTAVPRGLRAGTPEYFEAQLARCRCHELVTLRAWNRQRTLLTAGVAVALVGGYYVGRRRK